MSKNANDRKRARLHKSQNGRCFYCQDTIGILQEAKGFPVLEHYIPQHKGGTQVVLACKRCDKMKAMILGPEFQAIIKAHTVDAGKTLEQAVQAMAAICKARNIALAAAHAPTMIHAPRKYSKSHAMVEPVVVVALPSEVDKLSQI